MKSVFITGAGAGIGLATASLYARNGWRVGIVDRDSDALERARKDPLFTDAWIGQCDVTDPASVRASLDAFADQGDGQLHVLVNNAGLLGSGPFESLDPAEHERMIAVNIQGLTTVAQCAFPLLARTPGACLINLCSASALYGVPLLAVYSASKFYVRGLTEALHLEWAKHDIRVCSVMPPFVSTAMLDLVDSSLTDPIGSRHGPEDIAGIIAGWVDARGVHKVIGAEMKLMVFAQRLLPAAWVRAILRRMWGL